MKLDVVDSLCFAPLLGELESLCVKIDPNDRTLGANQARHKETDIANAATDIKYAHAGANPGRKQHPLGQRSNQLGLLDQTVILGARTAKRIVGIIHRVCLRSLPCLAKIMLLPSLRLQWLVSARPWCSTWSIVVRGSMALQQIGIH